MKGTRFYIIATFLITSVFCQAQSFSDENFKYEILSMEDFTVKVLPLDSKEYKGTITIPSEVEYKSRKFKIVECRNRLFEGCTKLEKVYLPKGMSTSPYMFSNCTNLDWQMVFDQMEGTLPTGIFSGCAKFSDIVIPARFHILGTNAFGSDPLNSITIENGPVAFSVSNPEGLNCRRLILDRNLETVLSGNASVEELEVGSNVTDLQSRVFSRMYNLKKVVFKGKNTILPEYCFASCESLTSVEFPQGTWCISDHCFESCKAMTTFDFPASITTIGNQAFCNSGLQKLVIPASVQIIGVLAFQDCKSLKEINLQASDDLLECEIKPEETKDGYLLVRSPFDGCENMTKILIDRQVPCLITQNYSGYYYNVESDFAILWFKPAYPNLKEIEFGAMAYKIPEYFLADYTYPVTVKLGENIKIIGAKAFRKCDWLISMELPVSVNQIEDEAFANTNISEIYVPEGVEQVGAKAFAFTPLRDLTGMANVKEIGTAAFTETKIQEFYCPEKVRELPDKIFSKCLDLKCVFLQGDLETIGGSAFNDTKSLSEIYCRCAVPPVFGTMHGYYFTHEQFLSINVYVPEESLEAYKVAPVWRSFLNLQAFDFTSVNDIADDSEISIANATVYDLCGKPVKVDDINQLPKGIYIVSDGTKAKKVMIK